jgi:hypothetical protein
MNNSNNDFDDFDYDYTYNSLIRKNTKSITIKTYKDRVNEFNGKIEYLSKMYNKPIVTSKTIKKPFCCPNGRKSCSLCSREKCIENKKKDHNIFTKYEILNS